ncbi:MAG TPA: HD domain-containing protein [Rhodothermales bacterium]|nr:HD domain-containing protein [Rhodothermales bacterium]
MDNELAYIVGSVITDDGPEPFKLTVANGTFETGTFTTPDPEQASLSIIQQQRFAQLVHEQAGVAFAQVRMGAYRCPSCKRWVDVMTEPWEGDRCATCATRKSEPPPVLETSPDATTLEARIAALEAREKAWEDTGMIEAVLPSDQGALIERAIALAVEAHQGQRDKAGMPYILHPLRMMLRMVTPEDKMVAVLHDVVEDTAWTLDALRKQGFPEIVIEAVDGLTRRRKESYDAFIARAARHPLARRVKLADLEDNLDLRRLAKLTADDLERLIRYQRAWHYLTDYSD